MNSLTTNMVNSFVKVPVLSGMTLNSLVNQSVKAITYEKPYFVWCNQPGMSKDPNLRWPVPESDVTFLWLFLVICAVHDWQAATVQYASLAICIPWNSKSSVSYSDFLAGWPSDTVQWCIYNLHALNDAGMIFCRELSISIAWPGLPPGHTFRRNPAWPQYGSIVCAVSKSRVVSDFPMNLPFDKCRALSSASLQSSFHLQWGTMQNFFVRFGISTICLRFRYY